MGSEWKWKSVKGDRGNGASEAARSSARPRPPPSNHPLAPPGCLWPLGYCQDACNQIGDSNIAGLAFSISTDLSDSLRSVKKENPHIRGLLVGLRRVGTLPDHRHTGHAHGWAWGGQECTQWREFVAVALFPLKCRLGRDVPPPSYAMCVSARNAQPPLLPEADVRTAALRGPQCDGG